MRLADLDPGGPRHSYEDFASEIAAFVEKVKAIAPKYRTELLREA